jgi:hypothetical protein
VHFCRFCRTFVLWGGVSSGSARYCSASCQEQAAELPTGVAVRRDTGICADCGAVLLSGGFEVAGLSFCSTGCHHELFEGLARQLPATQQDGVDQAWRIRQAACPRCGGFGPVDIGCAHFFVAAGFSRGGMKAGLMCRKCERRQRLLYSTLTLVLGWWSGSGLVASPVQLRANLRRTHDRPSELLLECIRFRQAALERQDRGAEGD